MTNHLNNIILVIHLILSVFSFGQSPIIFTDEEQQWIKDHPIVEYGYEPHWPPYEIYENGEYNGISGEYIRLIEKHTGIDMQPIPGITWVETITGLETGDVKVGALVTITEERKPFLEFTSPHLSDPLVIITRENFQFINSIEDLEGKTIILPESYHIVTAVKSEYPQLNVTTTASVLGCLKAVNNNKADAFIGSLAVTSYYIKSEDLSNLKIAAPTRYGYLNLGLATHPDYRIFRDIAEKVFANITAKEHIAIKNKWMIDENQESLRFQKFKKYLLYAIASVILLLIIFFIWSKTLMVEIKNRKKIEIDLKRKNEEKEILLKEVHHRVKNNLQMIQSLLNMQSRSVSNPEAVKVISDGKSRVMAMALIHKILYESEDFTLIDVRQYILQLYQNVQKVFGANIKDINLDLNVDDIQLNIEKAIPIGLILNELLSNSYKHAFLNKTSGKITITIHQDSESLHFFYSDDGIGIPDMTTINKESLGLRLINRLTNQLHAKPNFDTANGFNIQFSFSSK